MSYLKCPECGTEIKLFGESKIDSVKVVVSTVGNQHGLLPGFLASHNVNVVISGGMGEGAKQNLISNGIEIITGVRGNVDEVMNAYLNGTLKSSDVGCSGHGHSHGHDHGENGCSCGHN